VDGETIAQIAALVVFLLLRAVAEHYKKKRRAREQRGEPQEQAEEAGGNWADVLFPDEEEEEEEVSAEPTAGPPPYGRDAPAAPAEVVDPYAEERARFGERLDRLVAEAEELYLPAHLDRATRRVADVLADYAIPQATALRKRVRADIGPIDASEREAAASLEFVLAAVETFVEQRRHAYVGPMVGDADAMAGACYQPVLDFARMNQLPLTSATPVAVLSPFDLGIWTGFLPTGVAPLFLPPDFFARVAWWPALAHEIGHDFLAATRGADERVREQLGLPPEEYGVMPLTLGAEGLSFGEVHRVFGAWFEEIFCDVFGTLMLGPAYGYGMIELFASPYNPMRVASVALDQRGHVPRYDTHPPRHLRVLLCAHVLELTGEAEDAARIRNEWLATHGEIEAITYPVAGGAIGIPVAPLLEIVTEIANSLYGDGLEGFDGRSLSAIPGLDWGPHLAGASRRARSELLRGGSPTGQPARAVMAGAVMAWRQAPEREAEIIGLARRAIVGVTEYREDIYAPAEPAALVAGAALERLQADELREAFILHTLLAPPPALRSARRCAGGLIARGRWHRPRAWS
jgi:hypothetical protein